MHSFMSAVYTTCDFEVLFDMRDVGLKKIVRNVDWTQLVKYEHWQAYVITLMNISVP